MESEEFFIRTSEKLYSYTYMALYMQKLSSLLCFFFLPLCLSRYSSQMLEVRNKIFVICLVVNIKPIP